MNADNDEVLKAAVFSVQGFPSAFICVHLRFLLEQHA
jgi:hypothetical protein